MNVTTLNMTTLDGGVIIKKGGDGGSTPTPPSGGGEVLEGEYFLAKPNGRYWKFTFSPDYYYIDPDYLSQEHLQVLIEACFYLSRLGVFSGAAVCYAGLLDEDGRQLRADGVTDISGRLGAMWILANNVVNGIDVDSYDFNSSFCRILKECSVKTSVYKEDIPLTEYDLVSLVKNLASMSGAELTDEEVMMMMQQVFMLIPVTEEEYKAARREI